MVLERSAGFRGDNRTGTASAVLLYHGLTLTTGDARPPPDANAKRWGKDGARAMLTPKERIKIHAEIERENARKLREWMKKGGKAA